MTDREPYPDDDNIRDYRRRPRDRSRAPVFLWALIIILAILLTVLGLAFVWGIVPVGKGNNQVAASKSSPQQAVAGEQDAAGPQQVGKTTTFGDWIHACFKRIDGEGTLCAISQRLLDAQSKQPVFLWRISQDGKGGLLSEWQTPTGLLVNRGVLLDAGTQKPVAIPFQLCTAAGCQAVANLAPDFVAGLAVAQKATATVYPINGKAVELVISVKGLSEALAALRQ